VGTTILPRRQTVPLPKRINRVTQIRVWWA